MFNRKSNKGLTPVQYSVMRKNYDVTMFLIQKGANPYPAFALGWVSSWLYAMINLKARKHNYPKPRTIEWKKKKFFLFVLEEDEVKNIALPGIKAVSV